MISSKDFGKTGMATWHHLNGFKKHYIPNTADDSRGKLSDTKITDFSSIIAHRISINCDPFIADRKIEANQMTSDYCYDFKLYGILKDMFDPIFALMNLISG